MTVGLMLPDTSFISQQLVLAKKGERAPSFVVGATAIILFVTAVGKITGLYERYRLLYYSLGVEVNFYVILL